MQILSCNESIRGSCRQITVPSISALSSLADVKIVESSGCFTYEQIDNKSITNNPTKNRFIIWRTIKSQLFLEEHCFDKNIGQNSVCIQFQNNIVLPGTQIAETSDRIIILVSTVSSVHRIILPHPTAFRRKKVESADGSLISILSEINVTDLLDPKNHSILNINGSSGPTASACILSWNEEALFALGRTDGSITLVTLPHVDEEVLPTQDVLRQSSTVKRIWSGLVNPLGLTENCWLETCSSLLFHIESKDVVLYSISCDYKLRIWSCKNKDVLATIDVAEIQNLVATPNVVDGEKLRIKKVDVADKYYVTVFTSIDGCGQFLIILPSKQKGKRNFKKILNVEAFEFELIDFLMTPDCLWTCWRSNDQIFVKYIFIDLNRQENSRWFDLDDLDFFNPRTPMTSSPTSIENIIDFLFEPGYFAYEVVFKAIKICCKDFSIDSSSNDFVQLKIDFENYLRKFSSNVDRRKKILDENLFQENLHNLLDSLISCIFQYHKANKKILGLFCLPFAQFLPGIISSDRFVFIVPSDKIDRSVQEDQEYVRKLFSLITDRYESDNNRLADQFDRSISIDKMSPLDFVRDHQSIDFLSETPSSIVTELRSLLVSAEGQLLTALDEIIKILEPNLNLHIDQFDDVIDIDLENCLKSRLWRDLLAFSVRSTVRRRLVMCRNSLMIVALCFRFRSELSFSNDIWAKMETLAVPRLNELCLMYGIMRWFVDLKNDQSVDEFDHNVQRLANLRIAPSSRTSHQKGIRLILNDFYDSRWFAKFRMILFSLLNSANVQPQSDFVAVTLQSIDLSISILWPMRKGLILFDFLSQSEEHERLIELCKFLQPWCDEYVYVRFYLQGCSLLHLDKPNQALIEFRKAFGGLEKMDTDLIHHLNFQQLSSDDYGVHYFRQVAELFEQRGFNGQVIELCRDGLSISDSKNKETHLLWTLLFKHYLETANFDEAFAALNKNPEFTSRKTCLRLFVVRLLELKEHEKLISYHYAKFEQEFVEFLELRARTVDVLTENYYQILCAFFVNKSNYRRAAFYFYELAQRFKLESNSQESLRFRVDALCGCVTNLSLTREEYRWIVRPENQITNSAERPGASPKHTLDGEELSPSKKMDSMKIIDLSEIRKELRLAKANLIAVSKSKLGYLSPSEAVGQLINLNEFDAAISLAVNFDLPLESIFEALTIACINVPACNDYEWIDKNRAFTPSLSMESNASELCWRILETYLDHFSVHYSPSALYRCVCKCLLMHSRDSPTWLTSKFKKIDFPEYLRLLLEFDRLVEAQSSLCDYLKAILGYGLQEFALPNALHITQPPVCLPYSCIDQLLSALATEISVNKNASALEKKTELENELKKYFHQLEILSTVS